VRGVCGITDVRAGSDGSRMEVQQITMAVTSMKALCIMHVNTTSEHGRIGGSYSL
jgi:hypothetical protein